MTAFGLVIDTSFDYKLVVCLADADICVVCLRRNRGENDAD